MLQVTVDRLVYSVLGMDPASRTARSLNFFVYDSVKIVALLFVMISFIGFLRSYLPQSKVKAWLAGKSLATGNFVAALFGAVTPFCSCSSVPLFIGFIRAGIPLGVSLSFLITSPIVNEYLAVLMLGFFGWKITLVYVASGVMIGFLSGLALGRMNLEKYLEKDIVGGKLRAGKDTEFKTFKDRIFFGFGEAASIVRKLWFWILVGVGIGAIIHNYIPQEAIQAAISRSGAWSVPIAVALGVPMYGSCAAIVPIAVALFQKGVPLGTALSFMMAVSALSLPEAVMLRRVMKLKLIAVFFGVVTLAIILTGFLINAVQGALMA